MSPSDNTQDASVPQPPRIRKTLSTGNLLHQIAIIKGKDGSHTTKASPKVKKTNTVVGEDGIVTRGRPRARTAPSAGLNMHPVTAEDLLAGPSGQKPLHRYSLTRKLPSGDSIEPCHLLATNGQAVRPAWAPMPIAPIRDPSPSCKGKGKEAVYKVRDREAAAEAAKKVEVQVDAPPAPAPAPRPRKRTLTRALSRFRLSNLLKGFEWNKAKATEPEDRWKLPLQLDTQDLAQSCGDYFVMKAASSEDDAHRDTFHKFAVDLNNAVETPQERRRARTRALSVSFKLPGLEAPVPAGGPSNAQRHSRLDSGVVRSPVEYRKSWHGQESGTWTQMDSGRWIFLKYRDDNRDEDLDTRMEDRHWW